MQHVAALAIAAVAACPRAGAHPEGAPWGAANPDASESCSACHYDYEPEQDSAALSIEGLPDTVVAGAEYDLVVRLSGVEARISGFQLFASATDEGAGTFRSDDEEIEAIGAASRSTKPAVYLDGVAWALTWQAPEQGADVIMMYVAASASNDDNSPFGDAIHYRSYLVRVTPDE